MSNANSKRASNFKDLTGRKFGRLTVVEFAGRVGPEGKQRCSAWACLCECGQTVQVLGTNLNAGKSNSCGCLQRELSSERQLTHGLTGSSEWESWRAMWDRCTNPKDEAYPRYSTKRPPEEWRDFTVFLAHMGPKPTPKHTIERIDNTLPYGPGNCKWATWHEQTRNTSRNVWIVIGGRRQILTDWAKELGQSVESVRRMYTIEGVTDRGN
jgi:hypothetical protein